MPHAVYNFDLVVFHWLNGWAGMYRWLDWLIIFNANDTLRVLIALGIALVLCMLIPRLRYRTKRYFEPVFFATCSALFARFIITEAIRFLYKTSRPFETLHGVKKLVDNVSAGSFPSGHASLAFATAMAIYFYFPRTGGAFFVVAIFMGMGRVAAGVHWPSDIIGGAVVGILSAVLMRHLSTHLKKTKKAAL